jgi:ferredoxin-type protein NapG
VRRREFIKRAGGGLLGGGVVAGALSTIYNTLPAWVAPDSKRRGLVRPPGAVSEDKFLSQCIRCTRCSEACETGAIKLLRGHGRLDGTPHIVPEETPCNLCLKCGEACPTSALHVLFRKSEARMGTAVVDKRSCVSHNGTGICGACFTICPLKGRAITQGKHNAPTIDPELCVGCGLCEDACIVEGEKAIRVLSPRRWV